MLELRLPWRTAIPYNSGKLRLLFALTVAMMGIINGLTVLLPARPGRLTLLTTLVNLFAPFAPSIWPFVGASRTLSLILGFFLLMLAFGLMRGKQRAWQFAVVLLPLSALAHMTKGLDVEEAGLAMLLWFGLLYSKSCFPTKSDPWRLRQGIFFLAFGIVLLLLYSLSGFYILQNEIQLPGTLGGFIRSLLLRIVDFPAEELTPLTRHAAWFLDSIPWLSAMTLLVGMFFLLRPVSLRWWMAYQKERIAQMRQNAIELVRRYGGQTLSFFALAPENLCYLEPSAEGMVNYRLTGNVAVALGDPVCEPGSSKRVTAGFLNLCSLHDWRAAFYQVHPEHLPTYRALGLPAFKIGEEALLNPQTFTLVGSAMANVRTSCRRAEREGVVISWYEGVPSNEVVHELEGLSRAWLEQKGGKQATEMGFSMGRLDELIDAAKRAEIVANETMLHNIFL